MDLKFNYPDLVKVHAARNVGSFVQIGTGLQIEMSREACEAFKYVQ